MRQALGDDYLSKLCSAFGITSDRQVSRILIDIQPGSPIRIMTDEFIDSEKFDKVLALLVQRFDDGKEKQRLEVSPESPEVCVCTHSPGVYADELGFFTVDENGYFQRLNESQQPHGPKYTRQQWITGQTQVYKE